MCADWVLTFSDSTKKTPPTKSRREVLEEKKTAKETDRRLQEMQAKLDKVELANRELKLKIKVCVHSVSRLCVECVLIASGCADRSTLRHGFSERAEPERI